MRNGNSVVESLEAYGMYAGNFTRTYGLNLSLPADMAFHYGCKTFSRTARSIQFVNVMHLDDIGHITACLRQPFGKQVHRSIEHIHTHGKIGCVNHCGAALSEIITNILTDVVPAGRTHYHSSIMFSQEAVIVPEGIRCGEIYADCLLCICRSFCFYIFCCRKNLDIAFAKDFLDAMAHLAVSAYYNFHFCQLNRRL